MVNPPEKPKKKKGKKGQPAVTEVEAPKVEIKAPKVDIKVAKPDSDSDSEETTQAKKFVPETKPAQAQPKKGKKA